MTGTRADETTSTLAIDGGTPVRTEPIGRWPVFGREEEELLLEALHSGVWGSIDGTLVKRFEEEFAALQDARHGVATVNATMGLSVALKAVGVGPGDEVLVPPYTFIATASAALMLGAIPVFVDVDPETLLIDPARIDAAVTPRTKAIVPVHHGGSPADMDGVMAAARRHGLRVVEDAAQAHGAAWRGRPVGAIGDVGVFSFQSSKPINAGEGGMMLTDDDELDELLWSYRNVGRRRGGEWYEHVRIGWNLRMTEFQAAVLLGQMHRMPDQQEQRTKAAAYLDRRARADPGRRSAQGPRWRHRPQLVHVSLALAGRRRRRPHQDGVRRGRCAPRGSRSSTATSRSTGTRPSSTRSPGSAGRAPDPCPNAERASADEVMNFALPILMGTTADLDDVVTAVGQGRRARDRWRA